MPSSRNMKGRDSGFTERKTDSIAPRRLNEPLSASRRLQVLPRRLLLVLFACGLLRSMMRSAQVTFRT